MKYLWMNKQASRDQSAILVFASLTEIEHREVASGDWFETCVVTIASAWNFILSTLWIRKIDEFSIFFLTFDFLD